MRDGADHPARAAVRVTELAGRYHLLFSGALDRAGVAALRPQLAAFDLRGRPVAMDLTAVEFLDCAGVALLCEFGRSCRLRPVLAVTNPLHRKLVRLCGLDRHARAARESRGRRPACRAARARWEG